MGEIVEKNSASIEYVKERITMLGQFMQQKIDEDKKKIMLNMLQEMKDPI